MASPAEPIFSPQIEIGDSDHDVQKAPVEETSSRQVLQRALHCHQSGKPLEDPVVANDGWTYERSIIENDSHPRGPLYPNRALQVVLEKQRKSTSYPRSSSASFRKALEASQRSSRKMLFRPQQQQPFPETFYCPISMQLMIRPVIDPSGHTYEHDAIVAWIAQHQSSPVTRQPLLENELRDNKTLAQLMEDILGGDQILSDEKHPHFTSVRQWQEQRKEQDGKEELEQALPTTNTNSQLTLEEWELRARRQREDMTSATCCDFVWLLCFPLVFFGFPVILLGLFLLFMVCPSCIPDDENENNNNLGDSTTLLGRDGTPGPET